MWLKLGCFVAAFVVSTTTLCAQQLAEISGRTMGTTYSVKYSIDTDAIEQSELTAAIQQRLAEIDERMSTYRADSELSQFNACPPDRWHEVSPETLQVARLAIEISKATDGAFDPTVMPLVELWNFGPSNRSAEFSPPSDTLIDETRKLVGYQKLKTRDEPAALMKTVAGLSLDLSAIAKGYGVDEVVRVGESFGAARVMVEIGGEVRVVDGKTDQDPWRIGIEKPLTGRRDLETVAALRDSSMATSGNYRNFFEHNGVRYSHTIDPRTGWPTRRQLGSVSVVAESCARADALATAILVMGADAGEAWANRHGVDSLFLTDIEGQIERRQTGSFPIASSAGSTNTEAKPGAKAERKRSSNFVPVVLISFFVFGLALLGMAIGVIIGNRRIQGSCGGIAGLKDGDGRTACELCQNPSPACQGENSQATADENV